MPHSARAPFATSSAAPGDWAETGASGPTGNRYGDDAGHCCLAVVGPVELVTSLETGSNEREENMWTFARAALDLLARGIDEAPR